MRAVATTGYSHLFPGARLALDSGDVGLGELDLRFSDGVEVTAELLELTGGELALAVPAFVTAAGTRIGPRVWLVRKAGADGSQVLVLGSRAEFA